MAGNSYRDDRGGDNQWRREERDRSSSIFGDNDRDRLRGGSGGHDDRGFFERAGEEVRSWLGFDEGRGGFSDRSEPWGAGDWAERDQRSGNEGSGRSSSSHYGREHGFGGFQGDYSGGGGQGGFGGRGDYSGGRQSFSSQGSQSGGGGFSSLHDDSYRSWRDRQIEQMDRDYEDYCRERQHGFHNDFDSWRRNRQSQGGSGLGTSASTGSSAASGSMTGTGGTADRQEEGGSGATSTGSSRTRVSRGSAEGKPEVAGTAGSES